MKTLHPQNLLVLLTHLLLLIHRPIPPPATSLPSDNPLISSDSTTEVQSSGLTPHSIVSKPTTDSTPIACKAVKALRIAFDDGTETWNRITKDELLLKLASSLKKAQIENAILQTQTLLNKSEDAIATTRLEQKETQEENPEDQEQLSEESEDAKKIKQKETLVEHYDDSEDILKKIADLLHVEGAQLREKWVYIVDSGGQPAYQELLPVFTRAATLNVITLDISKNVDEEFEFMYRING